MKHRNLRLIFFASLVVFGACEDQTENKTLKDVYNRFVQNLIQNSAPAGTPGSEPGTGTPGGGPGTGTGSGSGSSYSTSCAIVRKATPDAYQVFLVQIPYENCKKEILWGTTPEENRSIKVKSYKRYLEIVSSFPSECAATITYLQDRINDPSKITVESQAQIDSARYYPVDSLLKEMRNSLLNAPSAPISEETYAASKVGTYSEYQRFEDLRAIIFMGPMEGINETTCVDVVGNIFTTEFPPETYFWEGKPIDSPKTFLNGLCYYGKDYDAPDKQYQKCTTLSEEF
ncbi:hypothetical protein [Leptospira perolatii]|uniref:Lipoprotein n=1 Tax=Leptospira perolatii TaxID=2023191 RepID=A0ABX4PA18_9LEPT|nr:hypothetical protein [Leptospira perolatii]PJZ69016.1 hypothetical protein CH360_13225 [Leptospira perolatii]